MGANPFRHNARGCRCSERKPEQRPRFNLPDGACGWCRMCGAPGHERRFPGPIPIRGAWCDRHFELVRRVHPLGEQGIVVWTFGFWAVVFGTLWLQIL